VQVVTLEIEKSRTKQCAMPFGAVTSVHIVCFETPMKHGLYRYPDIFITWTVIDNNGIKTSTLKNVLL